MQGLLLESRVVILNVEEAKKIYGNGFFGKPIGVSKPKGPNDIDRPLELSLVEALYLIENSVINVVDKQGNSVSPQFLREYAKERVDKFDILYKIYSDLRKRKFVVRSGIKFGADFAVYTIGPGIEHAPFVVIALDLKNGISPVELMSFGRVSHSTRKTLVLGLVDLQRDVIKYVMFKWVKM